MKTFFISAEDKSRISQKVEELYQKAKTIFPNLEKWNRPSWDAKVTGTTGGYAYLLQNRISLNAGLFNRNKDYFFNDTIPHEMAHLIAFIVYKERGHGPAWKNTMKRLGYEPTRCHSMDVSETKRKMTLQRWVYKCGCPGKIHYLTSSAHSSILGGMKNYRCQGCRGLVINQNLFCNVTK